MFFSMDEGGRVVRPPCSLQGEPTMISGISGGGMRPDFSQMQAMRQQAFSKADTDGSGGLKLDEFKGMVEQSPMAKMGGPKVDTSEAFGKMDADGDGSLTETELGQGMQQMMQSTMAKFGQGGGAPSGGGTGSNDDTLKKLLALLDGGKEQTSTAKSERKMETDTRNSSNTQLQQLKQLLQQITSGSGAGAGGGGNSLAVA
jgi:hypothetical protein